MDADRLVVRAGDRATATGRLIRTDRVTLFHPGVNQAVVVVAAADLDWHIYQLGPQHGEDGQAHIAARLARVLPEIADWAATQPPGLVVLEPWLSPPSRQG